MNNSDLYHNMSCDGIQMGVNIMTETVLCEDIVLYDDHNVFTENEGVTLNPSNQLHESGHDFVDKITVKVYNKVGLHSCTLGIEGRDEHDKTRDRNNDQKLKNITVMQILNKQCYDDGNWGYTTYLSGITCYAQISMIQDTV